MTRRGSGLEADEASKPPPAQHPTALVVDLYSLENRGDAAIAAGVIASLRSAGARTITVAPHRWLDEADRWATVGADAVVPPLADHDAAPKWARGRLFLLAWTLWRGLQAALGVRGPGRNDPALNAYRDADVVVAVGGGYLGGSKPGGNLIKGLNIAAGRLAHKPVIVAGVTVTPAGRLVAHILRWALHGTHVFVRDKQSHAELARLGLPSEMVRDLCFRAPAAVEALTTAGRALRPDENLMLGWVPRDYRKWHLAWENRADVERGCLEAIARLMREHDAQVRFMAQVTVVGTDDDREAIKRLRASLPAGLADRTEVRDVSWSLAATIEAYRSVDVILASRLHVGLLALAAGTPSLVVGYDPKVIGVFDGLGLGHRVILPDGSWTDQRITEALLSLLQPTERELTEEARRRATEGYGRLDTVMREALHVTA